MNSRSKRILSMVAIIIASVAFGIIISADLGVMRQSNAQTAPTVTSMPVATTTVPAVTIPSFADIAARVAPAVVSITSTEIVKRDQRRRGLDPFEFFFPPDPQQRRRPTTPNDDEDDERAQRSGGSGFFISPDGYIITNNHVVEGASKVDVHFGADADGNGGHTLTAKIVGRDPATDMALLKVEGTQPFVTVPLGDSDRIRKGDWALAIGNPFQFENTLTVGVISAKGRALGLSRETSSFENFIQTDAAINFGSSGGPLINARGEVIGMTSAKSAEAPNIGFAIPIAQVVAVLPQLRERGSVARGFIGAALTSVTPALRTALGIEPRQGAMVEDVTPDAPAARAGLRLYDVVVGADGRAVTSDEDLIRYISSRAPGTLAALEIWRDGDTSVVSVKLKDRPVVNVIAGARPPVALVRPVVQNDHRLGLDVREIDARAAERLRLPEGLKGVLVSTVDPAGPARLAQIRANHVVMEVNRRPIRTVTDFRTAAEAILPGHAAAMLVYDRTTRQQAVYTVIADGE
jgi:serine protease Do